jgi:Mn2+/Fe2+ NRAMP family transporter
MKKIIEITLGIVTSVGGFLEIGSIATAIQAGALFGYQLLWTVLLGGLCLIFLVEQAGRLAAVSHHTIVDAIRERFGVNYSIVLLAVLGAVMLLVLAAEIGGVCIAIEFLTGVHHAWWAVPVGLVAWLIIWKGTFGIIEQGVSLLGLITLCFIIAAYNLQPDWHEAAKGLVPSLPEDEPARYWFIAVSVLGASISPYLMFFYSSGAIEDKWDKSYLGANRAIATLGMSFGSAISMAVLVVAALVFKPRGLEGDDYRQFAGLLYDAFGRWGMPLVAGSLAISCLGATLEIGLELAYLVAQVFGWNWGENHKPRDEARFSLTYVLAIAAATLLVAAGFNPLTLTMLSMALTAATLPVAVVPFLFLMNDRHYVGEHRNGWLSNGVVLAITALACLLALVSIPLELAGGG